MVFRVGQPLAGSAGGPGAGSGQAFSARDSVARLREQLGGGLNSTQNRTLISLAGESDAELFGEAVLDLARRVERSDNLEAATLLYQWIQSSDYPAISATEAIQTTVVAGAQSANALVSVRSRAGQALDAIQGRGAIGARAEFLMGRFVHEASDPAAIFAMGAAGALFRVTRLASLARLTAGAEGGFLTRGFGARAASSLLGFGVEATAFPLLHRAADSALGRSHPWDAQHLVQELGSSFLTLGALKFCGWGAGAAFRRTQGLARGLAPSFGQQAFQQAGMFGGILLGHGLETMVGLRQRQEGATTLVDALALMVQFNVAGNITRRAFGENFHHWERSLDLQAEALQRPRPARNIFGPPALALAGFPSGSGESRSGSDPRLANLVYSVRLPESGGSQPFQAFGPDAAEIEARYENKPEYRVEYPPDLDADLTRMEEQMRAPDYLEGSREELLQRRLDSELVDRLWFHQLRDLFDRIPYARYVETDDSILLTRMENYQAEPKSQLVEAARTRLGERGVAGSTALKIFEVRMSYQDLVGRSSEELSSPEGSFDQIGGLQSELQRVLKDGLQLMGESADGTERIIRIPSVSYTEALLQNAVGADNLQFHYVDGAISRDQVMRLRSRRVSPVGVGRGLAWLGDIPAWVHPAPFIAHDAITHGSLDSQAAYGTYEISQRFYFWLKQNGSGTDVVENLLDRLADGEMRFENFSDTGLAKNLRTYFERVIPPILAAEGPIPSQRLGDLCNLLDRARSAWVLEMGPQHSEEMRLEARAWEDLRQRVLTAARPRLVYPPSIEAAWTQIERTFSDPRYFDGDRRQLAARRADMDGVDAVWLHQAEHFVDVTPKMHSEWRDAEAILDINPSTNYPEAARLLREALALLGERGRPGSIARQVLVMHTNDRSETGDEWIWDRYIKAMPVLNMVEHFLGNRIRLETLTSQNGMSFVPSLSLLEALYTAGFGRRVQLHPVSGEITRDQAMGLRRRGVSPVGLSRQLIHLSHFEEDVHPFGFSAHDAIFHAGVLGKMNDNYPRTAGCLYDRSLERLPPGQVREDFMNAVTDLNVPETRDIGMKMFRRMMESSIDGARSIQEAGTSEEVEARTEYLLRNVEGFRAMVREDFNYQGGLVRAKGSFLKALDLAERRIGTAQRLRAQSDALEIGAPPLVYSNEMLDAIHEIEGRYQDPTYYEGSREELRAKRPPLALADQLWFYQARDYARRIPGSEVKVLAAESILEPLMEDPGFDPTVIESAIRRLPAHPEAREVLEMSIPREMMGPLYERPGLRFLALTPLMHDFQAALDQRVQLWGPRDERVVYRIPSLSLVETLIQAVHGEDRGQIHFVSGVVPRDVVSSLHARRVSIVGLVGAPLYFPEFTFENGDGSIHPWSFSQHDALEHAARDASVEPGIPDVAHWIYTRIRERFPDSILREETLDRLTDIKPDSQGMPFEALSRTLFEPLHQARSRIGGLAYTAQKAQGHQLRVFGHALRQLIREEFPNHPELQANRIHFESQLENIDEILGWATRNDEGVDYLSRISYSPADQANWDAMLAQFGRYNYLNAAPEWVARNRMPEDLVDRHWHFLAEDWARSIPGASIRMVDLNILSKPVLVRELVPDAELLRRATEDLGERGLPGSRARQVLEIEMPAEEFERRFPGEDTNDKSGLVMGTFFNAEEVLGHRLLLVEPGEGTIRFRIPALSFYEKFVQAAFGADRAGFHYVQGEISRDQAMALRAARRSPVGLARNHIFLGDIEGLVHPFLFASHDAFFHGTRDATVSTSFSELAPRLYRYLGNGSQRDFTVDDVRSRLSELDNQVKDAGGLSSISRDLIYLLNRSYENAGPPLLGEARVRELSELDDLSAGIHSWIRNDMPNREEFDDRSRASYETLMRLRRNLRGFRQALRIGRRSE